MKSVIFCKPFGNIKSYSAAIQDTEQATITPIIYFQKSVFLSEEEYHKFMQDLEIKLRTNYIPITEEIKDEKDA
jgi:hypothetical protein